MVPEYLINLRHGLPYVALESFVPPFRETHDKFIPLATFGTPKGYNLKDLVSTRD